MTGISNWFSPYITINSVLALKSFVLLNSIGIVVLAAISFRRNFFCSFLCPVGCVLDLIPSPNEHRRKFSLRKIPRFGIWVAIISFAAATIGIPLFIYLDPVSIFNAFFSSFIQTSVIAVVFSVAGLSCLMLLQFFIPGLWCFRICPLGGLQMLVTDIRLLLSRRVRIKKGRLIGRRLFIGSTAGAMVSLAIRPLLKQKEENIIRPPGALAANSMAFICTRCGSCMKSCPTGILKEDIRITTRFLTPVVSFDRGYCLETCNHCGSVCPSGAISPFDTGAKSGIHIGIAVINVSDCLLTTLKECDRCKAVCPYNAVDFVADSKRGIMIPAILSEKCVGCGACKVICPVECIGIKGTET